MQAVLALLTMSALAFAGCAGDNGDHEADHDDHDDGHSSATQTTTQAATTTSGSGTSTTSGTQAPGNQAPTGSVSAAVNGTAVTFTLTGSDPDGDAIAWDLEFGDGEKTSGTTLPATVEHSYAAGNHTANFTITDGKDPTSYNVTLAIGAAGSTDGPVQVVTAGWQVGTSDIFAVPEFFLCESGPGDGVTHATFTVEPQSFLVPFVATITDASDGAAIVGWTLLLFDAACGVDFQSYSAEDAAEITGSVPEGYVFGLAISDGGIMPEITITFG